MRAVVGTLVLVASALVVWAGPVEFGHVGDTGHLPTFVAPPPQPKALICPP